jgi:hypothetical protein
MVGVRDGAMPSTLTPKRVFVEMREVKAASHH